jgi:hypothetical protein
MRKAFVFLIKQLVLFLVFFSIDFFLSDFDFLKPLIQDGDIMIGYGDTSTGPDKGKLILYPPDTDSVVKGQKVTWSIDQSRSNVFSFRIVRKNDSKEIFKSFRHPPSAHTHKGTATVRSIFIKDYDEYNYSIYWKTTKDGTEYEFDPKIAIKPSTNFAGMIIFIGYGLAALLLTLMFFSSRNKK